MIGSPCGSVLQSTSVLVLLSMALAEAIGSAGSHVLHNSRKARVCDKESDGLTAGRLAVSNRGRGDTYQT